MKLLCIGSLVWYAHRDIGRLEAMRQLLGVNQMTKDEAEDAQAARELASRDREDDPQPGAFYGLPAPEPHPCPASTTSSPATT